MNYYIALSVDGSTPVVAPYSRVFEITEKLHAEIAETVVNQVTRGQASRV